MKETLDKHQQTIYQEMMSHPILFAHKHPTKVAIIGNAEGLTQEILKHPAITELWQATPAALAEPRIKDLATLNLSTPAFDIIILATDKAPAPLSNYYQLLHNDGMLLYQSTSPFDLQKLKADYQELKSIGFHHIQVLNFPQPHYPSGWRAALIAAKNTPFKRMSEKDIFNRPFTTQYYNFDVHKASLALPEFMREELTL